MVQSSGDHNHHDSPHDDYRRVTHTVERALAAAAADTTNAFVEIDEGAVDATPSTGPMSGIPLAVKDLIDHAGHTTTAGSAFYRKEATATAPALARLEAAGAVVIGRTGLHEFAFGFTSENPWFGPVRNPWDPAISPGGSSGGSAAAVAAGIVPVALGTDTGGSVRVPAALCGVVGLKTTHGLIPLDGVFPLVPSLDTVGAIAQDLDLLGVATRVMAGDRWPHSGPGGPPRFIVPDHWVTSAPDPDGIQASFSDFLAAASEAGFVIEHRDLRELGPSAHQIGIIGPEAATIHATWRSSGRPYGDDVGARLDAAIAVEPEAIAEARHWREALTNTVRSLLADGRYLLTPAVAAMNKVIGEDRIGEHHHRPLLSWFSAPVNVTGCPALTIPIAGQGRMPSVQIIGDHGSEPALLAVGSALQERHLVGMSRWSTD